MAFYKGKAMWCSIKARAMWFSIKAREGHVVFYKG